MVVKFMTNGKSSLKEELDITKRKLQNMSQLNDQLKTRNTYLQNRMSPLVKEKQELQEELYKYKAMELKLKSKEIVNFKIDYNKMKHRTKVTKELLDKERKENKNLNKKIDGLNKDVDDLFEIIDEISENILKIMDENYLLKDLIIDYQYQSFWDFLREKKPENLTKYEKTVTTENKISQIYKNDNIKKIEGN